MRRRHPDRSARGETSHVWLGLSARALPLFLGLLFAAPAFADGGEGPGENARADEYFRQGKAFVKEDRWEEARRAYLAGYKIKRGYDIAGNLGNVELELGLARDAAEHLAYCIKSFTATGTAAQLAYVKGRFEEARQKVSALSIQVNVDGAEVFVDGRSIGRSPFADDVYVDPGARTLDVKLAGFTPFKRAIQAGKGSWQSVALVLRADVVARAAAPAHSPLAPAAPPVAPVVVPPPSRAPFYVAGLAGLAGIGAGVAGLLLSQASASRADTQFNQLKASGGAGACLDAVNEVRCDALDQAYRDKGTFRNVSIAGFGTAGAAVGVIITYALLSGGKPHNAGSSALKVDVAAGPAWTGALLKGSF